MALENPGKFIAKKTVKSSLKAALFAALTASVVPQGVEAQPTNTPRCTPLLQGPHNFEAWINNGNALYTCANHESNQADRAVLASLALMAFYNSITVATDVAGLSEEGRNDINFNIRTIGLRVFGVGPARPNIPLGTPSLVPEIIARNAAIASNNTLKNANLAAVDAIVNSIVPPGVTVTVSEQPDVLRRATHMRNLAKIVLESTDRNVAALSGVLLDTLRASMGGRCTRTPQPSVTGSTEFDRVLCANGRTIAYADFLMIAREISTTSPRPNGINLPDYLLEGTPPRRIDLRRMNQLGLSDPNHPVNLRRLVEVLGEQFYLLHLYGHLMSELDSLAMRFGGTAILPTLSLVNRMGSDETTRVIRPDAEIPLPQTPTGPLANPENNIASRVLASPETAAHRAWNDALAARHRRVTRLRVAGLTIGGVGFLTFGIAGGINLAERAEATDLINTPIWQERVNLTNRFVADARAGLLDPGQIVAGNARTLMFARQYQAEVESHNGIITATQVAAWTGLGVAIFGGALAALADVIAGPVPVEPREVNVPAAPGQSVPHPAPTGSRAEVQGSGVGFMPNIALDGTSVNVGATITF